MGTWSARRGSYRILYEIHDDAPVEAASQQTTHNGPGVVLVVDIDHRRDIYRRR